MIAIENLTTLFQMWEAGCIAPLSWRISQYRKAQTFEKHIWYFSWIGISLFWRHRCRRIWDIQIRTYKMDSETLWTYRKYGRPLKETTAGGWNVLWKRWRMMNVMLRFLRWYSICVGECEAGAGVCWGGVMGWLIYG